MTDGDPDAWTRNLIADMRAHGGTPSEASGWAAGKPFIILTSTGAKTGKERTAITTYHKDGNRWVIAALSARFQIATIVLTECQLAQGTSGIPLRV